MNSKMRTASWILLAVMGALVLLVSLISANLAYRGDYPVGGVSILEIASGRDAVLVGLRGTRGTAAAWGAAWAALFLAAVIGPYRRGDVATWWGILISLLALTAVAAARVVFTTGRTGISVPVILLGFGLVALLLDARRLSKPR